ncbi:hypothetical protein TNCV_3350541 [Trichonephila clavipes]|nr:hypothetical protein TNCV_3350541 [Trichonephila clavipes]
MYCLLAVSCILVFILGLHGINGSTYLEPANTENGYCEVDGLLRIPVGETGYNDKECEAIECSSKDMSGMSCGSILSSDPNCFLVKGEGHYPDCCPRPKCHKKKEE